MFNFIFEINVLIWTISTLFMLYFSIHNAILSFAINDSHLPFSLIKFIYYHFVPFVNTYKCFKIIKKLIQY